MTSGSLLSAAQGERRERLMWASWATGQGEGKLGFRLGGRPGMQRQLSQARWR